MAKRRNHEHPVTTAMEELVRIDRALDSPKLLIGGLAVKAYYKARNSADIDLVCDIETVQMLLKKLYPGKDYEHDDQNEDDLRPSFVITHRTRDDRVVFFGPKILERGGYEAIDWERLSDGARPLSYRKEELSNILLPSAEALAFMKLLAFASRMAKAPEKGQQDLIDFIELSNGVDFRTNKMFDFIRNAGIETRLRSQLQEIGEVEAELWRNSLFVDFLSVLSPIVSLEAIREATFADNYSELYSVNRAIEFYSQIADQYDARNSDTVKRTHNAIIKPIEDLYQEQQQVSVLDIGSGTGRMIASHFFNSAGIRWTAIDPCPEMRRLFEGNVKNTALAYDIVDSDVAALDNTPDGQYDIVILSLLLSSLEVDPDFAAISRRMKDGALLLVTDFYESGRYYDFDLGAQSLALYTRRVDVFDLLRSCVSAGLQPAFMDTLEGPSVGENTWVIHFRKSPS